MTGLVDERCEGCGRNRRTCPECGSTHVSVDSLTPEGQHDRVHSAAGSPSLDRLAYYADDGSAAAYALVCWDCGRTEERTLTVSVDSVEHGDEVSDE